MKNILTKIMTFPLLSSIHFLSSILTFRFDINGCISLGSLDGLLNLSFNEGTLNKNPLLLFKVVLFLDQEHAIYLLLKENNFNFQTPFSSDLYYANTS